MHKDKATLLRRARAKYIAKSLSTSLLRDNPKSPLKNSYYGSLLCSHNLYQVGKRITTSYCKQRWCAVCNRIRTAKLIAGYLPALRSMKDPQFVTLTKQTVAAADLSSSMDLMEKVWRQILQSEPNKKRKIRGIRKSECTIRPLNHYHFHYHVIVDGRENAEWLIQSWLTRFQEKADPQAQDCRPADETSLKEMFKYFTKLVLSIGDYEKQLYPPKRMDVIFQAMKGRRTVQPFGGIHAVKDDIDDLEGQVYESLEGADQVWKWSETDWYNDNGDNLTGYEPSERFKQLFKSQQD